MSKTFHQKCLLQYIAERVTRITDNKDRADELYTTESAVMRQSEQTAFLVADDSSALSVFRIASRACFVKAGLALAVVFGR